MTKRSAKFAEKMLVGDIKQALRSEFNMARFCGNCGEVREDDDIRCRNCGLVFRKNNNPTNGGAFVPLTDEQQFQPPAFDNNSAPSPFSREGAQRQARGVGFAQTIKADPQDDRENNLFLNVSQSRNNVQRKKVVEETVRFVEDRVNTQPGSPNSLPGYNAPGRNNFVPPVNYANSSALPPVDSAHRAAPYGRGRGSAKKVIIALAAFAAAVGGVLYYYIFFMGYRSVVSDFEKYYTNYDYESIVDNYSEIVYYDNKNNFAMLDNIVKTTLDTTYDYFDEELGTDYRVRYTTVDTFEMTDKEKDDYLSDTNYPEKEELVEKIRVVEITMTAKKDSHEAFADIELTLSKENGKWQIYDFENLDLY
ncbi:MAG: hypothetical protein II685_04730 [Clostridia bacterium]|nr:hypothetical protein [Clostridia bacterium]